MIKVSVLGYGTVGSGVVEVIQKNAELIKQRAGVEIVVKSVLDLRDFPEDPVQELIVHDFEEVKNDDEVQIVVETMGGLHPAYEYVKASLESGKSVCTSNKALVAAYGPELLAVAQDKNVNFLFEASVGGGIPIIRPLKVSMAPEEILEISGILNGTTNYILTEMTDKGADFDSVLKEAQEKGYAEKDPTADIEGHDACRKIAILTSLAYGKQLDFEDIYTEGITKITDRDINYAKKLGAKVKIFGSSKKVGDRVSAMVAPKLITSTHPLYSVDGVFNAILVKGNMVGDVMFYGQGAGKLATASAVVSDVIDEAKHVNVNMRTLWDAEKLNLMPLNEVASKFFVRVHGNRAETEQKVVNAFGKVTPVDAGYEDEFAFVTEEITEGAYEKAANEVSVINKIRFDV
ncbi:MAG: homoserine dehydrogenase [Lachnospiraceae bacterium]|jgi:homoserine dehydrogenase|nr:homoserine dehydrogenase [Lachnospiraceae bacterium]